MTRVIAVVFFVGCGGGVSYNARPITTARGDGHEVECWDSVAACDEGAKRSCAPRRAIVIGNAEEKVGERWRYKRMTVCRGT